MRDGYVGNTELQKYLQRPGTECRPVVEAISPTQEDIRETQSEWTGSGGGLTFPAIGGARLSGSGATRAQHDTASADQENVVTDLDKSDRWFMLELDWSNTNAPDWELHQLTATLDPDVDGTGREVSEFRAQLYRVAVESENYVELEPISGRATAEVSGNSQADFTFDFFGGTVGAPPETGDSPESEGGFDPGTSPLTYVLIWAVKSDGAAAGNVAWVGDNDDSASGTTVTDGSSNTAEARLRELDRQDTAQAINVGGKFEKFGVGSGIPDFSLDGQTYSAATATFTGIDLGSAPAADTDLRLIGVGEEPRATNLTWEVSDDSGSTWTEYVDGDVIGEDNTDRGGKDLSSVSRQQTYQLRVTLTPNSGRTPTARRIGVEELTTTMLEGLTEVSKARWSFDPITLVAEIPEMHIPIIKDGVRDYRSEGEELFSENHIGDLELRVWIGHPDLDRAHWLHVEDVILDDFNSEGATVDAVCLSPLERLKAGVPPYNSATDERTPVTYSNQTLKAAWDDLLDTQVALPARYRGPGVEDTTSETVSTTIEDSDGKAELDAIAHLAGGIAASSQGRVKFLPAFIDSGVRAVFFRDEIKVQAATPGFRDRVDEYFTRYGHDATTDSYKGEVRSFHSDSLTKLGQAHIDAPDELRDEVTRWIPDPQDPSIEPPPKDKNLAGFVGHRTTDELGTGLKQLRFDVTSYPRPQLEIGDPVAVQTDAFVFRHPESDQPLRGILWVIGVIQAQENVMGTKFTVWVQQVFDAIPSEVDVSRISFANPEITGASGSWDDAGNVDVTGKVREADAVRIATSTSSFPSKSTTQSASLQSVASDNTFDVSGLTTINVGQTAYISILAYENSDGSGAESTLFKTKVFRATQEATQNLLSSDAGPEHVYSTSAYVYYSGPIDDLDLDVGDVISYSAFVEVDADGSTDGDGYIDLRFKDSGGSNIRIDTSSFVNPGTSYTRVKIEGSEIPENCTTIEVALRRGGDNTKRGKEAMLNRGPIAYSFVQPPARINRGEVDPAVIEEFQVLDWAFNGCTGDQMTITMEWVVSNFSSSEFTITLEFWGDWDGDGVYGMKDSETADSQIADTTASSDHYTYSEIPYKDDTNCAARDSYVKMLVTRDSTGEVVSKEVSRTIRFNAHACIDGQCAAQITGAE